VSGATLDTSALIALEAGNRRMAALIEEAIAGHVTLAIPAAALAQAARGGGGQARLARLLRSPVASVVDLDQRTAMRVAERCGATGTSDVVGMSVALCARDHDHAVITTDPDNLRTIDPSLSLLIP